MNKGIGDLEQSEIYLLLYFEMDDFDRQMKKKKITLTFSQQVVV